MHRLVVRATLLICALSLILSVLPGKAAAQSFSVQVDGQAVSGTMAELRNGQLMVAVRPLVEAMGATVTWSQEHYMLTIRRNGSQLAMWIGSQVAFHDGERLTAPVEPYLKNDRSMVPAWWLAIRLGADVRFTGDTLIVNMGGAAVAPQRPAGGHPLAKPHYVFPFPAGVRYDPYVDTMGAPRFWQGNSFAHEGIDIFASRGTPLVAVASGTIVRFGWNTLGGYRVTVQLDDHPEYRFYYAHLDSYAPGLREGGRVRAGQLIGYVGSTGEGPERTEGKFPNHLHFGVYGPNGAINPFELLRYWENHKVRL